MTDKLTIADIRKSARCAKGFREFWFATGQTPELYHDFLENGIDLDLVRHIDDIDVRAAVKCADIRIAEAKNGVSK